jgi:F-box/leucine-rich repeat protein 7
MDKLIRNFLEGHVLFKDYANEKEFISSLVRSMKPRIFVDGAYIVRKGEIGKAMFFNLKGCIDILSDDGETVINTMEEGSFFGEIGVLFSVPRTVSCRSNGKSIVLTLTKESLDCVLKPYPDIEHSISLIAKERYSTHLKKLESAVNQDFSEELDCITQKELREVPIFKDEDVAFLHKLALTLKPIKFYQNQKIIKKGDMAKEIFFVVKGIAQVVDDSEATVYAEFTPIRYLFTNVCYFGEAGLLLRDNRRTATVKCASEYVVLFKCEKSDLDTLLEQFPNAKSNIEQELQRRLEYIRHRESHNLNQEIAIATEIETVREKLKTVLLKIR